MTENIFHTSLLVFVATWLFVQANAHVDVPLALQLIALLAWYGGLISAFVSGLIMIWWA